MAWSHLGTNTGAQDAESLTIPSMEISSLGMTGFNAGATRTAIGLAVNLPQFRYNDTYQIQLNLTFVRGSHVIKAGADVPGWRCGIRSSFQLPAPSQSVQPGQFHLAGLFFFSCQLRACSHPIQPAC